MRLRPDSLRLRQILSRHRAQRWASGEIIAPIVCLLLVSAAGVWPNGFFDSARNWLFDAYQRFAPARRADSQTVLIDIDAESIRRVGQWPWPRDRIAQLIEAAKGARIVGIDLLLNEPDRSSPDNWIAGHPEIDPSIRQALSQMPSTDAVLADAIRHAPVIMAEVAMPGPAGGPQSIVSASPVIEVGDDPRPALPRYGSVVRPLRQFAEAARGLGIVTMPPEPDGVLRRVPAIVAVGTELMPSFVLEILRQWSGADRVIVHSDAAGLIDLEVGSLTLKTDQQGRIWPRYARERAVPLVPAYSVLDGEFDPALLRNRIALIGVSAPGLGDVIMSPLRNAERGVNVHAQLIESLLANDVLWRPPAALGGELLMALILGLSAIALLGRLPPLTHTVIFAGLVLLLASASWTSFVATGLLLDWSFPTAALVMTGIVALSARIRAEVKERRLRERDLQTALMRAEAADRTKTEFLANVSHELRTPLSAIIGFSEIMKDGVLGPLPERYGGYVKDIYGSGVHLLGIIQDVLELSVLELGGARATDDLVDIPSIITECVRLAAVRAEARRVTIADEVPAGLPRLRADPRMLRQMVSNVLSNAVKYSPEAETVNITGGIADGWLFLSLQDRGRGIAEADVPKALTPFGRLQSAQLAQEAGIGIGLSLTKSMLELHGGMLQIKSQLGCGTEVLLWFPPERVQKESET